MGDRLKAVVTGAKGFIGRNLSLALTRAGHDVVGLDVESGASELADALVGADAVFHLAGVNRPQDPAEFETGNRGSVEELVALIRESGASPFVALSSSTQAELDNPYGKSKLGAEEALASLGDRCSVVIFRLTNVFGRWSRPNYNSVVSTFCHNVANGLEIEIHDPSREVTLIHVDDVVSGFIGAYEAFSATPGVHRPDSGPTRTISLGDLADLIRSFRGSRQSLFVPNFGDEFVKKLYGTYLSYLPTDGFGYDLDIKEDNRGILAEILRFPNGGQIFISRTKPGITRGNHYHDTKTEKFIVVEGQGVIRFRHVEREDVIEYRVNGDRPSVVDIPVGYTHSIENVGDREMVTLFWACEPFDPNRPDTYFVEVLR